MKSLLNVWTKIKAWFNYSWSIFLARLEVLTGILVGAISGIDWTAIMSLDFKDSVYSKNNIILAAILIIKGIISEVGRRSGTVTTTQDQLVAVNIAEKADLPLKT
jgi:hypothetical protein